VVVLLAVATAEVSAAHRKVGARGAGRSVTAAAVDPAVAPPVAVEIPSLNVSSRLVGLRTARDGTLQVPQDPAAAGWWSQGPAPGDDGPAVIAGHVDSFDGPGVFFELRRLAPGDEILVRRADGIVGTFLVTDVQTYAKRDFPTDLVYAGDGTPSLRLVTCGGAFDEGSRTYRENVVVFAAPR
jgi:sortase (surface protein transpeptidase)